MSRDLENLDISELKTICRLRRWTIGTAESCTGGLLAAMIVRQPGVSGFFRGSVVSYHGSVKANLLEVAESKMATHGEVSVSVAVAMARGARKALKCDWAVSVTGIAGPDGGTPDKPVGTVCFAVVGPGVELYHHKQFQSTLTAAEMRQDIQRQAALFAFDFLLTAIR